MATYGFPIETLKTSVETFLATEATAVGDTAAPHRFGKRYLEEASDCPLYVWVPARTKQVMTTSTRAIAEPRALAADAEQVQIYCWGSSFAHTWAMRHNVRRACHHVVGASNIRSDGGEWKNPGAAWTQRGELYVLELSVTVPIFDQYIELSGLTYPAEKTATIAVVQGDIRSTTDLAAPGESYVTTTTEDL